MIILVLKFALIDSEDSNLISSFFYNSIRERNENESKRGSLEKLNNQRSTYRMAKDGPLIKPRIMARLQNTLSWKQFQDSFDSEPQQRAGFSKSEFYLRLQILFFARLRNLYI